MTIPKNSKKAKELLAKAKYAKVYSLDNGFSGKFVSENLRIRKNGEWMYVGLGEFLANELADSHCKLTSREREEYPYTIHIHSNLWYEFEVSQPKANNPNCDCGCAEG